jgi:nucleoside-diphosphate-sugar epimerase
MPCTVLVTGSRGAIGRVVVDELRRRGHRVRGYDRLPPAHADDRQGELADAPALRRCARGIRALVHLAAMPDEGDFLREIVPNNIVGLHHALDAAIRGGARRVVLASTLRVAGDWWRRPARVRADAAAQPIDSYAWSKAAGELLAGLRAREHRLSVVAARIGMFPRNRREWAMVASWGTRRSYLSWADTRRFFARAVEARLAPGFVSLNVVSAGGERSIDLGPGRELIGFHPVDRWPDGTPELSAPAGPAPGPCARRARAASSRVR